MNAATTGSATSADVRFDAHYGLKSDIARGPKSAQDQTSLGRLDDHKMLAVCGLAPPCGRYC
jgi:hypothetical protein